jgi:hypothetical protein
VGSPTITASGTLGSATHQENVPAAPVAGLAFADPSHTLTGAAIGSSYTCTVAPALGNAGSVTAGVSFVDRFGNLAVQSTTLDSTINLSPTPKGT